MLFWFVSLSILIVALVFQSAAVDYRLVALGAVLPVAEVLLGGPYLLHTLLGSVLAMAVVMGVARGRRLVQRRWLGVPIGLFLHLVLDGTWTRTELFWWPFAGFDVLGEGRLPEFDRPLGVILVLEVIGLVVGVWLVRAYDLTDPGARARFLKTGRLG
ncbi:MAG: hypothetical protein MUE34_05835 [Acidimicrobiales bacterium]|nr:hypothetical protein [Acidimicrobiales bacterium]